MIGNSLMLGLVVGVYPEGNSVDVLITEDGSRLSNVQVMVSNGSSNTGLVDLPDIGLPNDDSRWDITQTPARQVLAVVAAYRGAPIVLGFLLPQVNQITFKEQNRRIMRHASDVYTSIDKDGNTEIYHPSGTYLRIGVSGAHEDLTALDFDKKWAIANNTDKAPHVQLVVRNGGATKTTLDIAPNGNVSLTTVGTVQVQSSGNASIQAPHITLQSDVSVTGTLDVTGNVSAHGTLAADGNLSTGGTLVATGNVTGGGISLTGHHHGGVTTGGGQTGAPT